MINWCYAQPLLLTTWQEVYAHIMWQGSESKQDPIHQELLATSRGERECSQSFFNAPPVPPPTLIGNPLLLSISFTRIARNFSFTSIARNIDDICKVEITRNGWHSKMKENQLLTHGQCLKIFGFGSSWQLYSQRVLNSTGCTEWARSFCPCRWAPKMSWKE